MAQINKYDGTRNFVDSPGVIGSIVVRTTALLRVSAVDVENIAV